jgi:hypothetical protein
MSITQSSSSLLMEPLRKYPLKYIKRIEFESADDFTKYYNENKELIDKTSTCALNKKFRLIL